MPKPNTQKIDLLLIGLFLAIIYMASITIPVSDGYSDIYVSTTVEKPLIGSVEFTAVEAHAQPHTLLSVPALGSIVSSGTVVVKADTPSKGTSVKAGTIYRSDSAEINLVLRKVPNDESVVTVTLYESNTQVQTQVVELS